MKKWMTWGLLLLAAAGCSKEMMPFERSFTGTSVRSDMAGEHYMVLLVEDCLVDNLVALEDALNLDRIGLYDAREGSDYQPDGKSLWTPGAVWTIGTVRALNGLKIEKMPADSTWKLTRDDEYPLDGNSFRTEQEITARMLKGDLWQSHRWEVSVTLTRTEEDGYYAGFHSVGPVRFEPSVPTWGECYGTFLMEVRRDGTAIDRANLVYSGPIGRYRYLGGL